VFTIKEAKKCEWCPEILNKGKWIDYSMAPNHILRKWESEGINIHGYKGWRCYKCCNRFKNQKKRQRERNQKREQQQENQRLNNKIEDVSSRLTNAEQEISTCQSDVNDLKNSDAEKWAKIDQNTENIQKTTEEVNGIKTTINARGSLTEADIEADQQKKLKRLKDFYLVEKKDWPLGYITKKQREKMEFEDDPTLLKAYAREILETQKKIRKTADNTIYQITEKEYKIGWSVFLIAAPIAIIYKVRKIIKKKPKPSDTIQEEVQEKFNAWKMNMILSVAVYFVFFILLQGIIDKWVRPNIYWLLETKEGWTTGITLSVLGGLFLADGIITSELKTPLQRLSIKIESADISEKEKKALLSKTQQANETFKETLKRFGLLSIAGTVIKLLGDRFENAFAILLCYGIPLVFGGLRIWEVSGAIKKSKERE
jgi:uncharacterized membrane protein HdeD (DUF308 family)